MSETLHFSLRQPGPIPLDLSLSCPAGEILVLAGASGSGKTTVLRCLAGLYRPQYGQIRLGPDWLLNTEQKLWVPPQQRPLGLVFQHDALFPHLNARDNVALALLHQGRLERQKTALHWLERVQLGHRAQALPATLSGGERQRLALARALARQPRVLLLDEPFAALDTPLRQQLIAELAELRDSLKLAVIWVTHDLTEARLVGDQLALLSQGRLLQSGPPARLWEHPASADAARMLGLSNFLKSSQSGEATLLALSPEEVYLGRQPDGSSQSGRVVQSLRLGQRWRIEVELAQGTRVQAWSPQALSVGSTLEISWPTEALRPVGHQADLPGS